MWNRYWGQSDKENDETKNRIYFYDQCNCYHSCYDRAFGCYLSKSRSKHTNCKYNRTIWLVSDAFVYVCFLFTMTSGYKRTYADFIKNKVKRLLISFLFLSLFTFVFKLCLPSSMLEHGVGFNANYLFKIFFVTFRGPVPHIWFVISLYHFSCRHQF